MGDAVTPGGSLAGRVGVVTGASSGIGAATAAALAAEGMAVVCGARRADRLAAVVDAIVAAGGQALAVPTDLRQEAQVEALVAAAVERFGGLDALVNNAAIGNIRTIAEARTDEWRDVLETNVLGTMWACRAAVRHMLPAGRGDVVVMASASTHRDWPWMGAYAASKAAVAALARSLRAEIAPQGLRVMTVDIHQVATEFATNLDSTLLPTVLERWRALALIDPTGPILAPDAIARAVVFQLAQPDPTSVHELVIRPRSA